MLDCPTHLCKCSSYLQLSIVAWKMWKVQTLCERWRHDSFWAEPGRSVTAQNGPATALSCLSWSLIIPPPPGYSFNSLFPSSLPLSLLFSRSGIHPEGNRPSFSSNESLPSRWLASIREWVLSGFGILIFFRTEGWSRLVNREKYCICRLCETHFILNLSYQSLSLINIVSLLLRSLFVVLSISFSNRQQSCVM